MASDTLIVIDGIRAGFINKIRRLEDGSLVGVSGRLADAAAFLNWAQEEYYPRPQRVPFKIEGTFEALIVSPIKYGSNVTTYDQGGYGATILAPYHAIGAGCFPAMGALMAGADPVRAVEIAIAQSIYCGGSIEVLYQDDPSE